MINLGLDFESYYDKDYNIKKSKTLEYVRDEQFKAHGVSARLGNEKTHWVSHNDLPRYFDSLPWDDINLICHNTYFDGLALFTHYRKIPYRYSCTLSMGRALFPFESNSLENLGQRLGVGGKIKGALEETRGIRTLSPQIEQRLGVYAIQDTDVMMDIYDIIAPAFPEDERDLLDMTLRWGCIPTLRFDVERGKAALAHYQAEREQKIAASGVDSKILGSNPQFANHLLSLNITPPTKISKQTNEETFAFAKNDLEFRELKAAYPEHKELWEAREAVKSNLLITRTKRFINIGEGGAGTLPMPLKYCGAHTLRWSGQDGLNPQNFPRKSELRKSVIAPPGYKVVVADLSQIELRLNFWFCDQLDLLEVFRSGRDIYVNTAAQHYGLSYEEIYEGYLAGDPKYDAMRFFAKQLDLGLGYNMGGKRFRLEMLLKDMVMSLEEAFSNVNEYRSTHKQVVDMWTKLNGMIYQMFLGNPDSIKCVKFEKNSVILPNGMSLAYPNLEPIEGNWFYAHGKKIYGGLLLENIIQALARVVMGEIMLKIKRRHPWIQIVSTTHDEIIALAREDRAAEALETVLNIMREPPEWAPDLPLDGDGEYDDYYCK